MSLNQSRKSTISSPLPKNPLKLSQTKTKKKISKTKQSSKSLKSSTSRTKSVSKYFTNIKTQREDNTKSPTGSCDSSEQNTKEIDKQSIPFNNSISDDDFQSPLIFRKRNNFVWKLNNNPKPNSKLKNSHTKSKRLKNSTIEIIKENFQTDGENPEHLQMAIALSKSTYEAECSQSVEETPDVGMILQNVKPTNLERFGFKAAKVVLPVENRRHHETSLEPSKKVKNRFKYITPILNLRSTEDRERLIVSKMSCILGVSNPLVEKRTTEGTVVSAKLKEFLRKDRHLFKLDDIYEKNYFYTNNLDLPKDRCKCGFLLKDWGSIQGRDKSPIRSTKTTEQNESFSTLRRQLLFGASIAKSWSSSAKDSGVSIGSPCRSISPDLFGPDDEMCHFPGSADEYLDKSPLKERDNQETGEFIVSDGKNVDVLNHSASSNSLTKLASFYCLEEFEDLDNKIYIENDGGQEPVKNTESNRSLRHKVPSILNTSKEHQPASQKIYFVDIEKSPECIEILENSLSEHHFENMNANSSQLEPDVAEQTNFGLDEPNHSFDDFNSRLNDEEHDYLKKSQLNSDVSQKNFRNSLSQSPDNLSSEIDRKRFHVEDDLYHLDHQSEENNQCIEILDDSLQNIVQSDEMTVCNKSPNKEISKIPSMENTPKKMRGYNSTDLNVTDYVNNLLNKDSCSFNDCTKAADEDEMSNSQTSQSSIIVDEELNYSSYFSTPGRLRAPADKNSDNFDVIEIEAESNNIPEVNSKTAITTEQPLSTPDCYTIKFENVTPMPDYRQMTTPLINEELQKFGVKPLKRSRGAKLLEYIYESVHPLVGDTGVLENTDSEDDNRIIKRRKRMDETNVNQSIQSIPIVGDRITENEKPEELIFERRRSTKIPSCQVPLQIIWHNFLSCNPHIRENILLYEPLQLESLHIMLKEQGFKFHVQDLLTFLDKKCITIRTAQKQGKRHT